MRHARSRVDDNQVAIVRALRDAGCTVLHLHTIGKGCPDILVGNRTRNVLMEIKDGSKPPSRRLLTPDELEFHRTWRGQVAVVETVEEAIRVVNGLPPR